VALVVPVALVALALVVLVRHAVPVAAVLLGCRHLVALQVAVCPLPARHGVHFRVAPLPVVLVPGGPVRHGLRLEWGRRRLREYRVVNGIYRILALFRATLTGGP
jgi:hypothetical protein